MKPYNRRKRKQILTSKRTLDPLKNLHERIFRVVSPRSAAKIGHIIHGQTNEWLEVYCRYQTIKRGQYVKVVGLDHFHNRLLVQRLFGPDLPAHFSLK